ncbi:MAG: hypothetical protein PHH16_04670 [Candidatus Gracilibacteria bacterium]|nr:hypothetical protein [Candidatus Gracilibacteria bacterium]
MSSTEFDPLGPERKLADRAQFDGVFYKILACGSEGEMQSNASYIPGARVARIETIDTRTPGYAGQIREILEIM